MVIDRGELELIDITKPGLYDHEIEAAVM
jgi:hypothetical protein